MGLFDRFKKKKDEETIPEPVVEPEIPVHFEPVVEEKVLTFFEVWLQNTAVCKDKLKDIVVISDKDGSTVSYDEAFRRYYVNDDFFKWKFPVEEITFEKEPDRFKVFGDGLYLGDVKYSKNNDDYKAISELMLCHGIDRIVCTIKNRSAYFRVTSEEYNNTEWFNPERDDVKKKGTDAWFDEGNPKICLKIYCDPALLGHEYKEPEE